MANSKIDQKDHVWGTEQILYSNPDSPSRVKCIKILDTVQPLSIQCHPVKHEMWYVENSIPKKSFILLDSDDPRLLTLAEPQNHMYKIINIYHGECVFIPAGCPHALGPHLKVYEASTEADDHTYRLFDWDRTGRELHKPEFESCVRTYMQECQDKKTEYEMIHMEEYRIMEESTLANRYNSFIIPLDTAIYCDYGDIKQMKLEKNEVLELYSDIKDVKIKGNSRILYIY